MDAFTKNAESIVIAEDVYDSLTDDELKALAAHEIKHLYQGDKVFPIVCNHRHEYDADRASVNGTNLETALSSQRQRIRVKSVDGQSLK